MRIIKRLYLILTLLFCLNNLAISQDWNWAEGFGGEETEIIGAMKVDSEGAVYMAGNYKGVVDFEGTSFEALEGSDVFLTKLNSEGDVLWAASGGSFNNDVSIDVEVDAQGNVVWLGQFWIRAFFENDTIEAGTNAKAYFIAKYDDTGNLMWVESIVGTALKVVSDLVIDELDNIMVTGYFADSLQVGEVVLEAENITDAFLLKMNPNGEALWGRTYGDEGEVQPKKIEIVSNGDFVIAGDLIGGLTLGTDTLVSVSTDFDIFVGLVDPEGEGKWGRIGTGVFDNLLNSLIVDEEDQIYLTGSFVGVLGIDGEEILTPGFTDDLYLLKMNVVGDVLWIRGLSPDEFNDPSFSLDIAIKDDLIMMIGQFEGELIIDNMSINSEDARAFVAGFDVVNGAVKRLSKISGTNQSLGLEIEVGPGNLIHVAGVFFETISFDGIDLMSNGGTDVFVAQASDLFTGLFGPKFKNENLIIYPNPTQNYLILDGGREQFEVEIFDEIGRLVFYGENEIELNVKFLLPGIYFLKYKDKDSVQTKIFQKQ